VSVCIGVHLFAGQSNIMPRRRANVGRRTRRAERATATRGPVQLVYIYIYIERERERDLAMLIRFVLEAIVFGSGVFVSHSP
jgi:hypothetical protein